MEFEQYLERDILAFLDSKMQHKNSSNIDREEEYGLYLTRDYLKELNYALDNDELTKAKKIFDELKKIYSNQPTKSEERKKIYLLLERMYDKIQDYVKIKEGKIEIIKQGNSEIIKDKTDVFKEIVNKKETIESNTQKNEETSSEAHKDMLISSKKIDEKPKLKEEKIHLEPEFEGYKPQNNIESNTTSMIKNEHNNNYYEEQSEIKEEPEIITQNVFISKNKNISPIKKSTEIRKITKTRGTYIDIDSTDINEIENEIIEGTIHLEQLKTKIIEVIVNDLHQKMNEQNIETNKKIETIRKDIMRNIIMELDKRFGKEEQTLSSLESLKGEILNQAYRQAKNIITNEDNFQNYKHKSQTEIVHNITSPNTKIELSNPEQLISQIENKSINSNKIENNLINNQEYIDNKSNLTYNKARTHMINREYDNAVSLFKEILESNPNNKAANIRLNECLELSNNKKSTIANTTNEKINTPKETHNKKTTNLKKEVKNTIENNNTIKNNNININNQDNIINTNIEYESTQPKVNKDYDSFTKHQVGYAQLQKMYEEAIYTMFQNNYDEAAKLFQEILRIKPEHKAAKIRLQECQGVISNA